MSIFSVFRLSFLRTNYVISAQYATVPKFVASKGKKATKSEKVRIPVETDVNKLLTHVCGLNYHKEGEEVPLKPDDQYPEWLWSLRTTKIELSELDPNTKQYWRKVRTEALRRKNKMMEHHRY